MVLKQHSKYYEHFYKQLEPWKHYVPFESDLSNLVEIIQWAKENDAEARRISRNGQIFAQNNLMPQDVLCYHAVLFNVSKIFKGTYIGGRGGIRRRVKCFYN